MQSESPAASMYLYQLFMQAPVPMCVFRGDQLVYEMANPTYERVAGRGPLVGRRFVDVFPELEAQGAVAALREVMLTGKLATRRDALVHSDRKNDGAVADGAWTFTYAPLRTAGEPCDRIMAFCAEVTDGASARQEVERARRDAFEARERLQQALEISGLGTWESIRGRARRTGPLARGRSSRSLPTSP